MSEQFHAYSWPLDRGFTFQEWCDYLKAHPNSSNTPVAKFGCWEFNVHGACLNRARPVNIRLGTASFEVKLYQAPRGRKLGEPLIWNYDCWYDTGQSGGTCGRGEVEGDDREAIIEGLRKIIAAYERSIKHFQEYSEDAYKGRVTLCRRAIAAARQELEDRMQFTLFD